MVWIRSFNALYAAFALFLCVIHAVLKHCPHRSKADFRSQYGYIRAESVCLGLREEFFAHLCVRYDFLSYFCTRIPQEGNFFILMTALTARVKHQKPMRECTPLQVFPFIRSTDEPMFDGWCAMLVYGGCYDWNTDKDIFLSIL